MIRLATLVLAAAAMLQAQSDPIRVIAFGAHPDDCDLRASGLAAKYAAAGHKVKFVSVTNGDAGHFSEGGGMLAARRRAEAQESGRRLGIEYEVLDNHDGELLPSGTEGQCDGLFGVECVDDFPRGAVHDLDWTFGAMGCDPEALAAGRHER